MSRCESCGKRDRAWAYHCGTCGRAHWRDDCSSASFNDPLLWCWCGSPGDVAPTSHSSVAHWLDYYRNNGPTG